MNEQYCCQRKAGHGFTLIELLMAVAVIAILAVILVPGMEAAKCRAQRLACLGNLRQLNYMEIIYWNEFNRGIPRDSSGDWVSARRRGASMTSSYIRICPVASAPILIEYNESGMWAAINLGTAANCWSEPDGNAGLEPANDTTGSYSINSWVNPEKNFPAFAQQPQNAFDTEAAITNPRQVPVFCDGIAPLIVCRFADQTPSDLYLGARIPRNDSTAPLGTVMIARHGERTPVAAPRAWPLNQPLPKNWSINIAFRDGHAEAIRLADVRSLEWNRKWFDR